MIKFQLNEDEFKAFIEKTVQSAVELTMVKEKGRLKDSADKLDKILKKYAILAQVVDLLIAEKETIADKVNLLKMHGIDLNRNTYHTKEEKAAALAQVTPEKSIAQVAIETGIEVQSLYVAKVAQNPNKKPVPQGMRICPICQREEMGYSRGKFLCSVCKKEGKKLHNKPKAMGSDPTAELKL